MLAWHTALVLDEDDFFKIGFWGIFALFGQLMEAGE